MLQKNDYFHIHITFLNELNDQNHSNFTLNDFNMSKSVYVIGHVTWAHALVA